jgi:uncharacterized protein (DUF362 family)
VIERQRPPRSSLSRRELLIGVPLALAAACGRQRPYDANAFIHPERSSVALLAAADYRVDFADLIARGLREVGPDVRGQSVLLKPNLVEYAPGAPINTDTAVVAGAVTAFLQAGAREVVVGEGPGHWRDIEALLAATGLGAALRTLRVRFVDLNYDDVHVVPLASRFTGLDRIALPATVLQADLVVSLPKLKTHHWAGMTASLKNVFGTVPGAIYGWPKNVLHFRGIDQSILDLNSTVRPAFTIVDAVVGMEGDGPIMGRARPVGCIAMGQDLVAVDATCARVIGLDPGRLGYLSEAARFLGHADASRIEQRGEALSRFATRFDVLEHQRTLQLLPA